MLQALRREGPAADALLTDLMDEAMQGMLTAAPPALDRNPRQDAEEDFGPALTPAETAALADVAAEASGVVESGGDAMPTDEELAALFAEPFTEPPTLPQGLPEAYLGRWEGSSDALAVARELERDEAHGREEADSDAIEADVALEARGSVNLAEPPAPEDEAVAAVLGIRPPEPIVASPQRHPWWLAPLVWLNAPLAAPWARETAGKLGLLLLLNAVAVLVYVLVIRR